MRYLRLYRSFVTNNLARAMEFRAQFLAGIIGYAIWTGVTLVFIQAVFGNLGAVRGWSLDKIWVLYGTFVVLESLCYGLLGPNMWRFSGMVRDGSLDLALTRPVNVQFFVSARYIDPNGVLNAVVGIALVTVGLSRLGHWPTLGQWLQWVLHLGIGFVLAYSLWFAFVTVAIWAVKLDGISVIFDPMMQLARFPVDIYPRKLVLFFTVGIPVAFLTTYPTQALIGEGRPIWVLSGGALAAVMLGASNLWFRFALKSYGSASS